MAKVVLIARLVLGLIFFVFGLNGFFNFLPPPEVNERAGAFFGALAESGLINLVKVVEVGTGAMLLAGFTVPLALILLAPVVVVIFYFHTVLDPAGLPIAALTLILTVFLGWAYRGSYTGVLNRSAKPG